MHQLLGFFKLTLFSESTTTGNVAVVKIWGVLSKVCKFDGDVVVVYITVWVGVTVSVDINFALIKQIN